MAKTPYSKIIELISKNKFEVFLVLFILLISAFLRLYKIDGFMTFLGDEGRDAIIVRRLLVNFDPILIGPGTSIGNMYLGPLYYYLIAPSLFVFNFSPLGPSVFIAIIGVLTVFLVYIISREWFGKKAALIASILYSVSPTVIIYSRSSWNPNIMPFFALLVVYSIWNIFKHKKYSWFIVMGISFAFVLQSHYLGLLLLPLIVIYLFASLYKITKNKNKSLKKFIIYSLVGFFIFSFLMSPLLIFDARHGWQNTNAIKKFFSERQTTISAKPWGGLAKISPISEKSFTRLIGAKNETIGKISLIASLFGLFLLFGLYKNKIIEKKEKEPFVLLYVWLFFAFLGLSLYKQEIYDHYYGFFFPAPFILISGISAYILNNYKLRGSWIVLAGFLSILYINIINSPIRDNPNYQLKRSKIVADKIIFESKNKPLNLAVIAERNYEDGYQYFLEKNNIDVRDIDAQRLKETVTDQLFVVCELEEKKCDPTHNAKAEVANFGWSTIENTWKLEGVVIFKLIHSKAK